jgi:hypothetical protein
MSVGVQKLKLVRGDNQVYNLHFTDADDVDIDITGWTVYFTVKHRIEDTDANAVLKKDITSHSDPTHGITVLILLATDTDNLRGDYFYDVQIKKVDNTIKTVMIDSLEVVGDITRRTT